MQGPSCQIVSELLADAHVVCFMFGKRPSLLNRVRPIEAAYILIFQ